MKTRKLICLALAVMLTCYNMSGLEVMAQRTESLNTEPGLRVMEDSEGEFLIEDGVLMKYTGTNAEVVIPNNVTAIGDNAFENCFSAASITIPEGVTTFGTGAFANCASLTEITIPDSVVSIGHNAFYGCTNLADVRIPKSVVNIKSEAFLDCSKDLVLSVAKDSYAETYAKENNYSYKYLENGTEEPENPENPGDQEGKGCKYKTLEDGTLEITGYEGEDTELAIPSEIDGKRVTSIGQSAFSNGRLISITIPDSVVKIDHYAFDCCLYLKEVILPDSVTDMGGTVFRNCNSLKSVRLSNGLTRIEPYTFESCNSLTEIVVPENVKSIGWEAFRDCTNLSSIVIPESVEHIEEDAFKGTKWLQEQREKNPLVIVNQMLIDGQTCEGNVEIPNGVTSIEVCAFDGCSSMIGVTMPDSLQSIGECAFRNCTGLADILIPSNVTYIGNSVFAGCSSLKNMEVESNNSTYSSEDGILYDKEKTKIFSCLIGKKGSVKIPESVINIQGSAFRDCVGLTGIIMSEGVEFIEYGAFVNCSALTGIEFPESLKNIGDYAFYNCSGLVEVKIPRGISHIGNTSFMECSQDLILLVEKDSYAETYAKENNFSYKYLEDGTEEPENPENPKDPENPESPENPGNQEGKGYKYNILEDGTLEITGYEGEDTELAIPSEIDGKRVTSIGKSAFDTLGMCSNLTNINIPDSVVNIGDYAFYSCSNLTNINIPDSVADIGEWAFFACSSLKSITIPGSVTSIKRGTFTVSGLQSINISEGVESIESGAFVECYSLKGITIPGSVTNINRGIFTLSGVEEIIISEGVKSIAEQAFVDCFNLKSVTIPGSVTSIGEGIFNGDSVLKVVKGSYAETYAKENNIKYVYVPGSASLPCAHTWNTSITKATTKKDGVITKTCTKCGEKSVTTIYAPATIKISEDTFTYNNKSQKPSVTIKDSKGKNLSSKTDYRVTYPKAAKDVGQYTVTINFKGNYSGTVKKSFTIVPKGTPLSKIMPKKKSFTVKWKKQRNQTTGYEVAYSTDSKFPKKNTKIIPVKKNGTTSKSIGKLKTKKKYFVRIRTYKDVKGKKYYSGWSKVKSVTTKK